VGRLAALLEFLDQLLDGLLLAIEEFVLAFDGGGEFLEVVGDRIEVAIGVGRRRLDAPSECGDALLGIV
jgi:hypothetical protein